MCHRGSHRFGLYLTLMCPACAPLPDSASSLVSLVLESKGTYKACVAIVLAIMRTQSVLRPDPHLTSGLWPELNNNMAQLLREFQVAVRDELKVNGVERSLILFSPKSHREGHPGKGR